MVNFINLRLAIFILATAFMLISFLGSPNAPIYATIIKFDLDIILAYFHANDEFFRPPDTAPRFILFSISFILLMSIIKLTITRPDNDKPINKYIIILCIGIFYVSFLTSDNIYNYAAIILILFSLLHILYKNHEKLAINESYFVLSFALMFYIPMIGILFHSTTLSELDNFFRFFLAVPIYFLIRSLRISFADILMIFIIGGIFSSLYGLYLFFETDSFRVRGYTSSASIFTNIMMIYFLISLISFFYFDGKRRLLSLSCLLLTLSIISIASTRASLLTLVIVISFLFFSEHRKKLFTLKPLNMYISLIIGLVLISFSNLPSRISNSYNSAYNFINDDSGHYWQHEDSIVPRLIIWQGSINMIKGSPIKGVGLSNFNRELLKQIDDGTILPVRPASTDLTAGMNHAHNQYFDIFAKLGIIGFIILCFFMIVSYWFFNSYKHIPSRDILALSLVGKIIILTYTSNMLTHAILAHQQSTLFMTFTIVILAGVLSKLQTEKGI